MKYHISSNALWSAFPVPSAVVDKHIKMAGALQLRVLLCVFRNPAEEINAEKIAKTLSAPVSEVADALVFWAECGVLATEEGETVAVPQPVVAPKKAVRAATVKPTREEVARRGMESPEITFLLREAEAKFGRALRQTESSTLVWLCDDEGMSIAVLLMLVEFAISDGKANIGYIEKTALSWLDSGVCDIAGAEQKINDIYKSRSCWGIVSRAFGIERRMPSKKEEEFSLLFVGERKMSTELLKEAYNRCIDATGKFSIPYITKILDKWYKNGVKKVEDIKEDGKKGKDSIAAYDTTVFDSMLSAIDND